MKKLSRRYQHLLLHRSRQEMRKRQGAKFVASGHHSGRLLRLIPPHELSLDSNYAETVALFERVRQPLLQLGRSQPSFDRYVDFREIHFIEPSAALVIAAEFDRARRISGRPVYTVHFEDWAPDVVGILLELGFFELLRLGNSPPSTDDSAQFKVLRFVSGRAVEGQKVGELSDALAELAGTMSGESETHIFDGLTEAMTNVSNHAYPEDHDYSYKILSGRWWMTGAFDKETRRLFICFFDQGISIPISLPRWKLYEKLRREFYRINSVFPGAGSRVDDGEQIAAAMEVSRSATGRPGRGLGLAQMQELIDISANGQLRILSRRGEYLYQKDNAPRIYNHDTSIGGTLIEWVIDL
jgi:hypothetical protein